MVVKKGHPRTWRGHYEASPRMHEAGDGRQGPSQRVTVLESRVRASFLWFEKLWKISGLGARVDQKGRDAGALVSLVWTVEQFSKLANLG